MKASKVPEVFGWSLCHSQHTEMCSACHPFPAAPPARSTLDPLTSQPLVLAQSWKAPDFTLAVGILALSSTGISSPAKWFWGCAHPSIPQPVASPAPSRHGEEEGREGSGTSEEPVGFIPRHKPMPRTGSSSPRPADPSRKGHGGQAGSRPSRAGCSCHRDLRAKWGSQTLAG